MSMALMRCPGLESSTGILSTALRRPPEQLFCRLRRAASTVAIQPAPSPPMVRAHLRRLNRRSQRPYPPHHHGQPNLRGAPRSRPTYLPVLVAAADHQPTPTSGTPLHRHGILPTPTLPLLPASSVASAPLPGYWFSPTAPWSNLPQRKNLPDERTIALGKTVRTLQERMPTLLQSPLPSEILSPHIALHLFPTTHPNLPTVRGRVAYIAALWTAPVAWGRLPGGNMRLEVLSERMLKNGGGGGEQLVVRWRTRSEDDSVGSKTVGAKEVKTGTTAVADGEFSGIFVFEFDEKGRVATHTIENSEEGRDGESKVVSVAEWLLRKAKGVPEGGLAAAYVRL